MPNLIFRLLGDNRGFETSLSKAERQAQASGGRIGRALTNFAGGLVGVGLLSKLTRDTTSLAGAITDLSTAVGANTDDIQAQGFAVSEAGGNLSDLERAYKTLAAARRAALGGDERQLGNFAAMGVDRATLAGQTDPAKLLALVGKAAQATKADLNSLPAVLDLIGSKNMPVMTALADGLDEAGQRARDLGLIIDAETLRKLDRMGDRWAQIWRQLQAMAAPVLDWLSDRLEDTFKGFQMGGLFFEQLVNQFKRATGQITDDEFQQRAAEIDKLKRELSRPAAQRRAANQALGEEQELAALAEQIAKKREDNAVRLMSAEQRRLHFTRELLQAQDQLARLEAQQAANAAERAATEKEIAERKQNLGTIESIRKGIVNAELEAAARAEQDERDGRAPKGFGAFRRATAQVQINAADAAAKAEFDRRMNALADAQKRLADLLAQDKQKEAAQVALKIEEIKGQLAGDGARRGRGDGAVDALQRIGGSRGGSADPVVKIAVQQLRQLGVIAHNTGRTSGSVRELVGG